MDDFKLFQQEFTKWQQRFGLNGYKVYGVIYFKRIGGGRR